ncbi:MAG TPA: FAD:protein FMN transferase [Solirubrobacteraceae bacterium]|jgi:thiamine biosynthesis lipoprotein|nr:FAD:protein FMN transferase [Solirubrobacteraceae bacterium]
MRPPAHSPRSPGSAKWEALGTSVVLRVTDPAGLGNARTAVECELDAIDRACSRFRADSELSRVNARAGRSTSASPLLMQALELALRAAEITDGDVDPTVGRALELAGYDRDWRLLDPAADQPAPHMAVIARARAGWRTIALDRQSLAVRVPAGMRLDLGATAKAWAADRAASAAADASGCGALVGLGGDIATCGAAPASGWKIHVTDDHRSDCSAPGQTISIRSGGIATSSTAVRRWSHNGHTMHHIIDPRTGAPVLGSWRTVSVAAASCADANIAATAALVRAHAAPRWLARVGLPARLLDRAGNVTTVACWPERPSAA